MVCVVDNFCVLLTHTRLWPMIQCFLEHVLNRNQFFLFLVLCHLPIRYTAFSIKSDAPYKTNVSIIFAYYFELKLNFVYNTMARPTNQISQFCYYDISVVYRMKILVNEISFLFNETEFYDYQFCCLVKKYFSTQGKTRKTYNARSDLTILRFFFYNDFSRFLKHKQRTKAGDVDIHLDL